MKTPEIDQRLAELLEKAKNHIMTPEEKEAQRQSWVKGEMGIGTDADEAKYIGYDLLTLKTDLDGNK